MDSRQTGAGVFDAHKLAEMVADKRRTESLSVRQAAEAAGISFSTVSRVEAGTQPDLATFINLCGWLGVDPGDFTGRPPASASSLEDALRHLSSDPQLSPDASDRIASMVRTMYDALAVPGGDPVVAVHLRAAPMLRPGVPERLSDLLTDMEEALRRSPRPHGG